VKGLKRSHWIGLILLLLLGGCYTWATWRVFTQRVPGGNDFLAHYTAWEAYLKDGVSPYSDEAALHTQLAIYGRPALPGEDQNRLTYPFYSIILHGPFVLIDYPLARAIYMVLLQAALFAGVVLTLDLVHWRPSIWLLAVMLAWSLLFYPQARGVVLGQFAIFGFASLAGALFLLRRSRDACAGALLVLSMMKPTLIFLVIPFLLAWAVARRRWRFVTGFLGTLAVLTLGSLIVLPSWISELLYRITRYSEYTIGQSPVWLLTHLAIPSLGEQGELVIVALLVAGTLAVWWSAIRSARDDEFYWALGVILVVSNLIVPRSATTNYVLMLIPILWVFAALDRGPEWGRFAILASVLISLVGMWWLHLATVTGNAEHPIMFIPPPLTLGLVLAFGRSWLLRDAKKAKVLP
jgi:hypothetical protein